MRVVYGVLAAVAAAPFLAILWYALGILGFALALGTGPWAEIVFWGGTAGLVLLDVWIGYLAYRAGD